MFCLCMGLGSTWTQKGYIISCWTILGVLGRYFTFFWGPGRAQGMRGIASLPKRQDGGNATGSSRV